MEEKHVAVNRGHLHQRHLRLAIARELWSPLHVQTHDARLSSSVTVNGSGVVAREVSSNPLLGSTRVRSVEYTKNVSVHHARHRSHQRHHERRTTEPNVTLPPRAAVCPLTPRSALPRPLQSRLRWMLQYTPLMPHSCLLQEKLQFPGAVCVL
jgi:hypothetical protein